MSREGFRRPEDDAFMEIVSADIKYFVSCVGTSPIGHKSVLLFPPVNNYRRFVIHQICEDISSALSHFSIGHGDGRRTVVCFKTDLVDLESASLPESAMGIDHKYIPSSNLSSEPNHENIQRKAKVMPAFGIYRPPAARRLGSEEATALNSPAEKTKSKQRRPDIQVYVPRAKRASAGASTEIQPPNPPDSAVPVRRHSLHLTPQSQIKKSVILTVDKFTNEPGLKSDSNLLDSSIPSITDLIENSKTLINTTKVTHSAPVMDDSNDVHLLSKHSLDLHQNAEIMPEGSSSELHTKSQSSSVINQHIMNLDATTLIRPIATDVSSVDCIDSNSCDMHKADTCKLIGQDSIVNCTVISDEVSSLIEHSEDKSVTSTNNQILNIETDISRTDSSAVGVDSKLSSMIEQTSVDTCSENKNISSGNISDDPNYFITIGCETQVEKCVVESCPVDILPKDERIPKLDDEDNRCVNREEQNRKNRSIHRGNINFLSDLLVISDTEPARDTTLPHPDVNVSRYASESEKLQKLSLKDDEVNFVTCEDPSNISALRLNRDECTWDMMFDENGDCLDPFLMDELTSKVGSVTIKAPRSDYKNYATREFQPRDEYSHVVEIYNFPAAFKTKDLFAIFSPFSNGGFEIKWVDDTHCLGIFSSPVVAAEVLESSQPFCKTRPLCEATSESKAKARRSSEFLQPYRARPETCPALARRLVTGALGVRLSTARQEREAEKALLKVARDKKKLEARLKDEAWEGTLFSTSTTAE